MSQDWNILMSLQLTGREQEGIQVLSLKGSLVFGVENSELIDDLDRFINAGTLRIILNLNELQRLDTTGLRTLVYYATMKLPTNGGTLVLCDLIPPHMEMLQIITPEAILYVFHTEEDALDSFFPGRRAERHYLLDFARSEEARHALISKSDDGKE